MEKLGFLYVLNGVIAGMALAKLISGYASIIQYFALLYIYWIHLAFSLIVFVLIVQYWFFLFDWDAPTKNFWVYLISLIYPMILFFISSIIFPDIQYIQEYIQEHAVEKFPFKNYYYNFTKWYYGFGVIGVLISYVHNIMYGEKRIISKIQSIRIISGIVVLGLTISNSVWFHSISIILAVCILLMFLHSKYKSINLLV